MNDANKNIRSDEVEQALEILHNEGDAAMEEYLFPRGLNWIELYLTNTSNDVAEVLQHIKSIRGNFIKDPDIIYKTKSFRLIKKNAAKIVSRAAALKEIFLSHFGVDLDEERTKVCLDKEQSE